MRQIRIANFGAYLGPGPDYGKIIKAGEDAASKVEELTYRRLCSLDSLSILCSRYAKIKKAAERAFKKAVSAGNANNGAEKDYQRALRVIKDTFGQQLGYYAGEVVRDCVEAAADVKRSIKNGVYHGNLPEPKWIDGLIDDIKGVRAELDKAGINSGSVSKHVDSGVKKTEGIKKALEEYHRNWGKRFL